MAIIMRDVPCEMCGHASEGIEKACVECGNPTLDRFRLVAEIVWQKCEGKDRQEVRFSANVYRKRDVLRILVLDNDGVAEHIGQVMKWIDLNFNPRFGAEWEVHTERYLYLLSGETCPAEVCMMSVPIGHHTDIVSRIEPRPALFRDTGIENIPGKPPKWKIGRQETFNIPGAPPGTVWQPVPANRTQEQEG